MKKIAFTNPHRQRHFDFFMAMDQPHIGVTAEVDLTHFRQEVADRGWTVTPAIVYLLTRVVHELTVFRWRIRGRQVIEHQTVHPSFTVTTQASDVFSFCTVDYHAQASTFIDHALRQMDKMATDPSFSDEPGRDDYLFMSALPWVRFTAVQHAMHYSPPDSVPRFCWGKFTKVGEKLLMPLSVQAHHAIVDGRDIGHYFERVQAYLAGEVRWWD